MLDYSLCTAFDSFVDPKMLIFVLLLHSYVVLAGHQYAEEIPGGRSEVSAAAERPSERNVRELQCVEQSVGPNHEYFRGFLESASVFTARFLQSHFKSTQKGISPINYLLEKRIEEAKYLLKTTNLSVNEIGRIVGFSSQSYFAQSFKRALGKTPLEFRKSKSETE